MLHLLYGPAASGKTDLLMGLRNVYHRFMKRRYKNMEGFHDSRQK